MGAVGYWLAQHLADEGIWISMRPALGSKISQQRQELKNLQEHNDRELQALTTRLADLQARLMRLDALGERLVSISDISSDEFDFSAQPAVGGPDAGVSEASQTPDVSQMLKSLADRIDNREQQLEVLGNLLNANKTYADTFVAGSPVDRGWLSSRYGQRADPLQGAWRHGGLDFAGKQGSNIKAVALGRGHLVG